MLRQKYIFETGGWQTIAKAQEAIDHMESREEISQLGMEPSTTSLRFGYLSTIIQ